MSTIIANQRTALMFCPTLSTHSSHVWSAETQPALKSAVKSLPRPGPRVFYAGHGDQISSMLRCPRK